VTIHSMIQLLMSWQPNSQDHVVQVILSFKIMIVQQEILWLWVYYHCPVMQIAAVASFQYRIIVLFCIHIWGALMICFGQVCAEANVPLYLVDEMVKILTEECEHGLW